MRWAWNSNLGTQFTLFEFLTAKSCGVTKVSHPIALTTSEVSIGESIIAPIGGSGAHEGSRGGFLSGPSVDKYGQIFVTGINGYAYRIQVRTSPFGIYALTCKLITHGLLQHHQRAVGKLPTGKVRCYPRVIRSCLWVSTDFTHHGLPVHKWLPIGSFCNYPWVAARLQLQKLPKWVIIFSEGVFI